MSFRPPFSRVGFMRKSRTALAFSTSLFILVACDFTDPDRSPGSPSVNEPETERFHEKSFSWETQASAIPALAKTAARVTHFETPEAFGEAIRNLDAALQIRAFSDSLWKPIDFACDELDLAIWNTYGTVHLADTVVFNEAILKSRCSDIGGTETSLGNASADPLGKSAATYPSTESEHRVYPYKMIGRSWDNFDLVVYKSTGGETQFKKHREKLFTTAWWDTDATRIGVRIYLMNCGVAGTQRTCYSVGTHSDWYKNDDYVSKRDFSAGVQVNFTPPSTVTLNPTKLRVSDAVYALHSADHAGIAFRATSSSGLTSATTVVGMPTPEYVTW
jgi:hypothetical protein